MTDGGLWDGNAVPSYLLWVQNWDQSPTGRQVAWYDSGAQATYRRCAVKLACRGALKSETARSHDWRPTAGHMTVIGGSLVESKDVGHQELTGCLLILWCRQITRLGRQRQATSATQ